MPVKLYRKNLEERAAQLRRREENIKSNRRKLESFQKSNATIRKNLCHVERRVKEREKELTIAEEINNQQAGATSDLLVNVMERNGKVKIREEELRMMEDN